MADDKTEKPTPKRRLEARKKGQVAKSQDLVSAAVLAAGIGALAITGPSTFHKLKVVVATGLGRSGDPGLATAVGIGGVFRATGSAFVSATAPVVVACVVAGILANVLQVRFKVTPKAAKPNFKKINPAAGFKRVFGKNAVVEAMKAILKVVAVGGVGFLALWPMIPQLAGFVGLSPSDLLPTISGMSLSIAEKVIGAFFVIALGDWMWQKRTHEKSLKMSRDELKKEAKESDSPPEMKRAQAKKRAEMSRRRMLTDVPTADVVVVNPTHFAVALRYDGKAPAPQVVAKGQDLIAAAIRRIAEEHGVPVLANPPLARALYREVEIGHMIPEELFASVAEVLAFVYRTAGRRSAAARREALAAARPAGTSRAA
jgi:flagellar biosynthetic protein FlhB